MTRRVALALFLPVLACTGGPPGPAPLDTRNESCSNCRMTVSDPRFAAQVVAPGEVPRFFDDIGCLAAYLKARPAAAGVAVFVADHRSRAWARAETAVYTRVETVATPMGSHLVAHADAASRDQDADARGGAAVTAGEVFGAHGLPGSPR